MKRTPLKRYTPLRPSGDLARGSTLRRSTIKRRAPRPVPRDVYAAVLARDGGCRGRGVIPGAACAGRIDPHHVVRRSQGGLDTEANLVSLCRACHEWVHAHPEQSFALGFLKHREPDNNTNTTKDQTP